MIRYHALFRARGVIKMDARAAGNLETPRVIRMHADDNVAIVANEFGLPAGAQLLLGPALREHVPQGHKVGLVDIAKGAPGNTFTDHGMRWDNSGKNGHYAPIRWSNRS